MEFIEAVQSAELLERGLPPQAGGMLDQSRWFVEFSRFVWAERDRIRAEQMQR